MCLAAPGLSVSEDSTIIAFEGVFNDAKGGRGINFLLRRMLVENFIKSEGLVLTRVRHSFVLRWSRFDK